MPSSPLAAYVPGFLLEALARGEPPPAAPEALACEGAVLFADITGYTAMTELHGRAGPVGPERIRDSLNACFGSVIDQVCAQGGDVLNFAGDAVIALFRGAEASEAAERCAAAIRGAPQDEGAPRLRVSTRAGLIHFTRVGGLNDRWLLVAGGEPFTGSVPAGSRPNPRPFPAGDAVAKPVDDAALARWVPPLVVNRIAAGQGDWLAELRTVSVVFTLLPGLDFARPEARSAVQSVTLAAQQIVERYEGTFVQILCDETGCVALLAFGLPGTAHSDDAVRASRAALDLDAHLASLGLGHGIGVTTGHAFCGSYGTSVRRNYAVIGDVVNFAARLAQQKTSSVLCDEATTIASANRVVSYRPLSPIQVKGASQPRPVFEVVRVDTPRLSREQPRMPLVGRGSELELLKERLEGRGKGPILIEGEAGIGKTRVCAWLIEQAGTRGLPVLSAVSDALEATTPYHPWRDLLPTLLGARRDADDQRQKVEEASAAVGLPGWGPLLGPILQIDLPDSETTRRMSGRVRGDATRQLLIALVRHARARFPVLLLDDVQWLDPSSWELLTELCAQDEAPLLVLAHRPLPEGLPAGFRQATDRTGATHIGLAVLQSSEVRALLCQLFGTPGVSPEVVELIQSKSHGNPFFVREIARTLREAGALQVDASGCRFVETPRAWEELRLPSNLTGMVTHRLDRLAASQLMLLKVASVVARPFSSEMIAALSPGGIDRDQAEQLCGALCDEELLLEEVTPEGGRGYSFRHAIIRDVTYQLMAFAQRRALHAATARWIEQTSPGPAAYGLRAYHWKAAEDRSQWLAAAELAGNAALERGAAREALEYFTEALQLDAEAGSDDVRRAHWHAQMGDAWYQVGDVARSMPSLERALQLLGSPAPTKTLQWLGRGLREVGVQTAHLVRAPRSVPSPAEERRLLSATRVWSIVSELHYFATRLPEMTVSLLATANLAEQARAPELAARAYGILGYTAGLARVRPLADRYFRLGKQGRHAHDVANAHYAESLYELAFARRDAGLEAVRRGLVLAESVGDHFSVAIGRTILGATLQHHGRLREALDVHLSVVTSARQRSNVQHEVWGLSGAAECLVELGQPQEALHRLEEVAPLMPRADALSGVRFEGVRAWARLRAGDLPGAREGSVATLALLHRDEQPMYAWFYALAGIAEIGLELSRSGENRIARDAFRVLRRYAQVLPQARARLALLLGQRAALRGQRRAARSLWERALALGTRFDLPMESRGARLELALQSGDAEAARAALEGSPAALLPPSRSSELALISAARAGTK